MPPGLQNWHLDKRVPVGIIATIFLQTAGLVWYASKLDSRVSSLEDADRKSDSYIAQRVAVTEARFEALRTDRERLVKMETQIEALLRSMTRLEQKLDGGGR